jgi:hypothetical protein
LHGTHLLEALSHTGVTPTHALGFAGVHCTHLFVVVLHTAVGPTHCVVLDWVHCTQVPPLHAGFTCVGHAAWPAEL